MRWHYRPKNALIRRPSDRKCKVVGTDTRTMRRYAYLQYFIKYCFIHLPPPCPSSTSPQLRSTFDAASWDDFCQMGVPLYWKYYKRAFGKLSLRKSAKLAVSNAYIFGRSVANSTLGATVFTSAFVFQPHSPASYKVKGALFVKHIRGSNVFCFLCLAVYSVLCCIGLF